MVRIIAGNELIRQHHWEHLVDCCTGWVSEDYHLLGLKCCLMFVDDFSRDILSVGCDKIAVIGERKYTTMPVYTYRRHGSDQDVLVRHCRQNTVENWGQLCRRARQPVGSICAKTPVELVEQLQCACGEQYDAGQCCGCKYNKLCASLECDRSCAR